MNVLTVGKRSQIALPTTEDIVKAGLLFLISRSTVIGVFPFGLAFWAAVMPHRAMYIGLISMLLGVLSAGGEILKYSLAAGLYLIYTYFRKNKLPDSIFCGFFILISGIISVLFNSQSPVYIMACAAESVISTLTYLLCTRAESFYTSCKGVSKASQEELISVVILCGILLTGFHGLYITPDIHICTVFGVYIILCLSFCTNVATAGSIGLTLGFVCSMNSTSAVNIMGICGIGSLIASLLKDFSKIGCISGFFIGSLICSIYTSNFLSPSITYYEAGIASVMFLVTPKLFFSKLEAVLSRAMQSSTGGKEGRIKEFLSGELKNISKAFTDLAESFLSLSHENRHTAQASDMFDEVAKRICKDCPQWSNCWLDSFGDMYHNMYDILKTIENIGYCNIENLPIVFKNKCINCESFISEFNHQYELFKHTAIWHGEVSFGQDMVARQYHEISNLIKDLSDEVETGFSFIESAELKLDSALEKIGFFAKEINVIENSKKDPEVYISAGFNAEPELLEKVVSEVIGMPMRLENDSSSMKFVTHNKFYIEYAVCQHSGESEQICGDTIMQFETDDNKFCVLLCDGMGSGNGALEESKLTAELFQDFIKAGFIKDTAVKMINSTLAMKAGRESFSTIDLAEIDLRTGRAEFLKVGAAESYVKQKNEVEIISAKALPVGIIDEIQTPALSRCLSDGDIIIMASDGISDTGYGAIRGAWVKQLILNNESDMQTLADEVMKNARRKAYPKPCDDMTVAALRLRKLN